MLAWAEGTSTHPHTKDDGYDVIVNGDDGDPRPNIMTSYARHPNVLVKVNTNLKSTAADLFIGGTDGPPIKRTTVMMKFGMIKTSLGELS